MPHIVRKAPSNGAGNAAGFIAGVAANQGSAGAFAWALGTGLTAAKARLIVNGTPETASSLSGTSGSVSLTPVNSGVYRAQLLDSTAAIILWQTPAFTVGAVGVAANTIALSNLTVNETAGIGTTIGTLSAGGTPTITYAITADPSSKFSLIGSTLKTAALLDYETATSHSVTIQATNAYGSASQTFSIAVGNIIELPVSTAVPTISGTTTVGQTLTGTTGTFTSAAGSMTYAYQWNRAGTAISGATSSTYTLATADANQVLTLSVTATNSDGSTVATSAGTASITPLASLIGTVTTPSSVYAGNVAFVSGSLSGASAAKARLYSVTDSAYSGAAVDTFVSGGTWVCGNLPATASTVKTYRIDLLAADGVTLIQSGISFSTSLWTKPVDSWRATIATGQASATNSQGIFDSSANSTDMTALQASSTNKALVPLTITGASFGSAITLTSVNQTLGDNFVVVSATAHGLVAGDWINGTGSTLLTGNVPIIYVDANSFKVPINSLAVATGAVTGCVIKKITPNVRTIGFALTAPASPGAVIYATWKTNAGSNITATVSSTSFADASPTALTVVQPRPTTYQSPDNYVDRGALVQVPANAGTSFVKLALTNYDTATSYCFLGAFQLRSDSNHNLWLLHGPSITHYAGQVLELRAYYQALYPNSDPIFVNYGHPGAKYGLINSGAVTPSLATSVPWGYTLYDANPNDMGTQGVATQRPYATNSGSSNTIATDYTTGINAIKTALSGRPLYAVGGDYFNGPDKAPVAVVKSGGNTGNGTIATATLAKNGVWQVRMASATTFNVTDPDGLVTGPHATGVATDTRFHTNIKVTVGGTAFVAGDGWDLTAAVAVDGLRAENQGMKPYNNNLIVPALRGYSGVVAMRDRLDAPQSDPYSGAAVRWDTALNVEGTHPSTTGYIDYFEHTFLPPFSHSQTGEAGNTVIEDMTVNLAGPISSVWQARLNAALASLPSTANSVATARRAQLAAAVTAAASLSYTEPSVPTGATPVSWVDPARSDLVTLASGLLVGSVTDRIGGWSWAAVNVANNAQPSIHTRKTSGRNILRFGNRSSTLAGTVTSPGLECTAAGFLSALSTAFGAASAACTFIWVERAHPAAQFSSTSGVSWQLSNGASSFALAAINGSSPFSALTKKGQFASTSAIEGTPALAMSMNVYALVHAGGANGALTLYRNGTQVGTATVTKADWTALTIARLGMNSTINGGALIGDVGDWMAFSGALNTTNRQAWETYLTSKWA